MIAPAVLAARDDWETPSSLFERYHREYRFTLDPAANAANRVVETYFDRELDGTRQPWRGHTVWLHPPHSEPGRWSIKAAIEQRRGVTTVALLPARTGDGWWHDVVIRYASSILFLRGTPQFRLQGLPVKPDARPLPVGGFAIVTFKP